MKKSFKKLMPITMAGIMIFGSIAPIFAVVKETETVTSNSTQQTEVFYNQESSFEVIVPKLVDLGADKFTNYEVTVSGDISSDEVVKVVPEESFLMKDKSGTTNLKADVEATVTQDKTEWIFNEFEIKANGNISAPNLTAGNWEGSFFFNIKLDCYNISVVAKNEAGEDINASATYIAGSEKENLLVSLVDEGFINSIDEVDALINVKADDFEGLADTTFDVSGFASEGDEIVILHFDEAEQEWDYIGQETVNSNGLISGNFTSYSPVAFVKVTDNGEYVPVTLTAGLYDANGNLLCKWEDSGINININYTGTSGSSNYYKNTKTSPYYIITNKYPKTTVIVIPENITFISEYAFAHCNSLTNIVIPNSVTTIKREAFYDCDGLTSVELPKNITSIGQELFRSCDGLKNVTIPDNITSIGNNAFSYCSSLTNITIPESVNFIDMFAFAYCTKLKSIVIPEGVTSIEQETFKGCTSLKSITIPESVKKINAKAFSDCSSLTSITIPTNIVSITNNAIYPCKLLTSITWKGKTYTNKSEFNTAIKNAGVCSSNIWN